MFAPPIFIWDVPAFKTQPVPKLKVLPPIESVDPFKVSMAVAAAATVNVPVTLKA